MFCHKVWFGRKSAFLRHKFSFSFQTENKTFRFTDMSRWWKERKTEVERIENANFIMTFAVRNSSYSSIRQTSPCWPTWACACRWVCIRTRCCWSCFPTGSGPSCCSCSTSPATPFQTSPPLWTEGSAQISARVDRWEYTHTHMCRHSSSCEGEMKRKHTDWTDGYMHTHRHTHRIIPEAQGCELDIWEFEPVVLLSFSLEDSTNMPKVLVLLIDCM